MYNKHVLCRINNVRNNQSTWQYQNMSEVFIIIVCNGHNVYMHTRIWDQTGQALPGSARSGPGYHFNNQKTLRDRRGCHNARGTRHVRITIFFWKFLARGGCHQTAEPRHVSNANFATARSVHVIKIARFTAENRAKNPASKVSKIWKRAVASANFGGFKLTKLLIKFNSFFTGWFLNAFFLSKKKAGMKTVRSVKKTTKNTPKLPWLRYRSSPNEKHSAESCICLSNRYLNTYQICRSFRIDL